MIRSGQFLEWADIFGNLYGTSADDTERLRQEGRDVVLVIDVQGARQVRSRGLETIGIFVLPPSLEVLERRLRERSQDHDTDEDVRHRLDVARQEVDACCDYDYVVVNDDISGCVDRLRSIVMAERSRTKVVRPATDAIIASFRAASPAARLARGDE
jgi:guanylate kinase